MIAVTVQPSTTALTKEAPEGPHSPKPSAGPGRRNGGIGLAIACAFALVALGGLEGVRQSTRLLFSIVIAGGTLLAWGGFLAVAAARSGRPLTLEVVLRRQHYLQACAQASVL